MIKVLAVDDDKTTRVLYETIGRGKGWEVFNAESCDEALSMCRTMLFDIIFMDWKLFGVSGLDCTKLIRQQEAEEGRHTPIVGITAHAMESHRKECLSAGMDDYLSKPFRAEQLIKLVDKWACRTVKVEEHN